MKRIFTLSLVLVMLMTTCLTACTPTVHPVPTQTTSTNSDEPTTTPGTTTEPDTTKEPDTTTEPDVTTDPGTTSPDPVVTDPIDEPAIQYLKTPLKYAVAEYIENELKNKPQQSYMVSPLSFQYALGMLVAGADGDTKDQLIKAMGYTRSQEVEDYLKGFNSFSEWFNEKKRHDIEEYSKLEDVQKQFYTEPAGTLRVANSVWKREDIAEFLQDYKLRLEMFDAEHFSFTPQDIVNRANQWANEKTEGMIPSILPQDFDAFELAVLLMNALYYKNGWAHEFRDSNKMDFTTFDGKTVKKDAMVSTERYRYYKDDKTELVVVPMQDRVYMTFVLGDTSDLDSKIAQATLRKVCVTLPKFEIESSFNSGELVKYLIERGASDIFDKEKADLGLMIDKSLLKYNLYVSDIIQKTKIKLDETGVEAAAVTAIMVAEATSIGEPEQITYFTADKPFHFYIHSTCVPTCGNTTEGELTAPTFVLFEGRLAE